MVTDIEDINSGDKDIMMPPLIYADKYDDEEDDPRESTGDPTSADPTPEPVPPSEKPTQEPTSEPNYYALSEPLSPTREGYMGHLPSKEIVRY